MRLMKFKPARLRHELFFFRIVATFGRDLINDILITAHRRSPVRVTRIVQFTSGQLNVKLDIRIYSSFHISCHPYHFFHIGGIQMGVPAAVPPRKNYSSN